MLSLNFLVLYWIGLIIWRTGAQVTLTTKNVMDSFKCGDSEVLVCSINPYSNIMSWTKNTTAAQLASCTPISCTTNPSFASEYSFTFNTSSAIFEMTIIKVTLTDHGTTYSCDDGLNSDSVTADVVVNEGFNATLVDQQIDSNTTEVRVTTGCIKNTTAQNVELVWWLQEVNDTTGEKHYLDKSGLKVNDDSACKADTDCWIDGFTQINSILNLTEVETGKLYNVGINVTFGSDYGESLPLGKNKIFMLNYMKTSIQPTSTTTERLPLQENFLSKHKITVTVVGSIILLLTLVLVYICVRRRICKKEKNKNRTNHNSLNDSESKETNLDSS